MRLLLISAALLFVFAAQVLQADSAQEQRSFSAEDNQVKNPTSIPPEVLATLSQDPDVRAVLEDEHISGTVPASWLTASEVHLHSKAEKDLLVMAIGPLSGANVTTFWLFRPLHGQYEQILNAPAHDLHVKNTYSNGYRDIELVSATADTASTVLCRFQAGVYRPFKKSLKQIP